MTLAPKSIALLLIQLALVSSIAAKYAYQRSACPRVWTRAVAYDPELVMRGRYLSTRLRVDACALGDKPMEADHLPGFLDLANGSTFAQGTIGVKDGKLSVFMLEHTAVHHNTQPLIWPHSNRCSEVELFNPVNFYLSEKAKSPVPLAPGQELWIEVTVPPTGPPRPIQLALKQGPTWTPLAFQ